MTLGATIGLTQIFSKNNIKHITNSGHIIEFQEVDNSLDLFGVLKIATSGKEFFNKTGNTYQGPIEFPNCEVLSVKIADNPDGNIRTIYPSRKDLKFF